MCDSVIKACSMCPPMRMCIRGTRSCCLTDRERELLSNAQLLFDQVNPDKTEFPMSCCVIETLGKAETMLLLRTLRDEKHQKMSKYRQLFDSFASKLREAAAEDGDGGRSITFDEFAESLMGALNAYMHEANSALSDAIAAEYQEMERDMVDSEG